MLSLLGRNEAIKPDGRQSPRLRRSHIHRKQERSRGAPAVVTQNRFLAAFAGCFLPIGTIRISAATRAIQEEPHLV
jgi:hypothetical protein